MHHHLSSDSPPRNLSYGVSYFSKVMYTPVLSRWCSALVRRVLWQSCCPVQIGLFHSAFFTPSPFVLVKMPHFLFSVEFSLQFTSGCRSPRICLNHLPIAEPLQGLGPLRAQGDQHPLPLDLQGHLFSLFLGSLCLRLGQFLPGFIDRGTHLDLGNLRLQR